MDHRLLPLVETRAAYLLDLRLDPIEDPVHIGRPTGDIVAKALHPSLGNLGVIHMLIPHKDVFIVQAPSAWVRRRVVRSLLWLLLLWPRCCRRLLSSVVVVGSWSVVC